jgi:hypothetical protein
MIRAMPKTSTRNHQSQRDIFQQQANTQANPKRAGAVVQDKTAQPRNRAGSVPPEPRQKPAQSRPPSTSTEHPQKHGSTKRRTVHLVLWVKPIVKAELQRVAAQEGLSLSKAAGTLLARALEGQIDMNYNALLTPVIESAIRKEIRSFANRHATLLARTLFASEQTRSLTTNILGRQPGVNEDLLKNILEMTRNAAKGNLSHKTPPELIEAIEQWLLTYDEEEKQSN